MTTQRQVVVSPDKHSWTYAVMKELPDGRKFGATLEVFITASRIIRDIPAVLIYHMQVRNDDPEGMPCKLLNGRCRYDLTYIGGMEMYKDCGGVMDPDGDPHAQPEKLWEELERWMDLQLKWCLDREKESK